MRNKKGNIFFGLFIGIFLFAMGVLFIPFLTDSITETRIALDCIGSDISDGTKLMCLTTDLTIPYIIWFFSSLGIGYIIGRKT